MKSMSRLEVRKLTMNKRRISSNIQISEGKRSPMSSLKNKNIIIIELLKSRISNNILIPEGMMPPISNLKNKNIIIIGLCHHKKILICLI